MHGLCYCTEQSTQKRQKYPEPLKFRLLKALNVLQPLINTFGLPKKKQTYSIPKTHLHYLHHLNSSSKTVIPIVHFPASNPKISILILYCHGAGSNLNTVHALGTHFRVKFSVGFVGFDAMGEGESQGDVGKQEEIMKIMLGWAISMGYDLRRVVLCGFSVGAYSASLIPGLMPRILVSPFAGIIPFIEGKQGRFEGQIYDNIQNALRLKTRVLIVHGTNEMIPIHHAYNIRDALLENNDDQQIKLHEVENYAHNSIPNFLINEDGKEIVSSYFKTVAFESRKKEFDEATRKLLKEVEEISSYNLVRSAETGEEKQIA